MSMRVKWFNVGFRMFSISDKQYERYLKQQNSQVEFESQKQSEFDQEADNENPKN